ncbi:unnamed protein product, partial [Ectocarpus fasciculatus]
CVCSVAISGGLSCHAEVCADWNGECPADAPIRLPDTTFCFGLCDESACCE